ncbi:MAG TPA: (d)CMP kinase [Solirubrobacterales bacterium]|nr:(d)CMP kinase [Solirubrobacterales bacterium]
MKPKLDLKGLLADLARAECDFIVIGSSALAVQGWEVDPSDLDLFVPPEQVDPIVRILDGEARAAAWVEDGAARRLECELARGRVDIYVSVSGQLSYEDVLEQAIIVNLGAEDLRVKVGNLRHVRDMRAAASRPSLPAEAVPPADRAGAPNVIAIDGPAGAGKSTVTRAVAAEIGFTYLDTGAMYRCIALAVLRQRSDTDDAQEIERIARSVKISFEGERVFLDDEDVTQAIRSSEVTKAAPHIAAYPEVRGAMVDRQREIFAEGNYVAEGRDTGTVVAPHAPLKIYLTASPEERAHRRSLETGEPEADVLQAIKERDRLDSERQLSALKTAEDAVVVDTTGRSVDDVVGEIVDLAHERRIV